jgi:hypothetical protein
METFRSAPLRTLLALGLTLSAPAAASAQDSHWGVAFSITPVTRPASQFESLTGDTEYDLQGTEFTIGLARGRELGGDWAVSFIRKNVKDGSTVTEEDEEFCDEFGDFGCFVEGETMFTRNVKFNGLEVRKSVVFATVQERVQIGIDFAGGVGTFSGDVEKVYTTNGEVDFVDILPAKEELFPFTPVPIGRLHAAVGVIAAPGLKLRVSGGIGFPMNNIVTVTAVYLFGAN